MQIEILDKKNRECALERDARVVTYVVELVTYDRTVMLELISGISIKILKLISHTYSQAQELLL